MTQPQTDTTGPRAAQLLDLVYDALLRSDYAALPGMTALLEQELLTPSVPFTESSLAAVRDKAARNRACLMAAQRGVKAARRRLAEIRSTAAGLVTYDRKGRRAEVVQLGGLAQRL